MSWPRCLLTHGFTAASEDGAVTYAAQELPHQPASTRHVRHGAAVRPDQATRMLGFDGAAPGLACGLPRCKPAADPTEKPAS
jgi:hypothetical protein